MAQMNEQQLAQVAEQFQSELEGLEQQQEQLNEYLNELNRTKDAIDVLEDAEPGDKVLLPLGSGAFVHARLDDADTVLAPIGSDILAEEPPTKARERLEERRKEAKNAQQQVQQNIQQIQQRLQNLVSQAQGGQQPPGGQERPEGPGKAG